MCTVPFLLALTLLVASPAAAQQLITRPPTLVVEGTDKPIAIEALDVEARIVGHLAETSMTLTFFNPANRVLAGDLTFPLPAGATVSGYALDVNGTLVDGVVVDKVKARQVFETEVRKGVDPGLVERVAGAAFRTRVFPIPAKGRRTIKVSWVSEVALDQRGARYLLPLGFEEPIDDVHVRIDVVRGTGATIEGDGIEGLGFEAWEDRQVAEVRLKKALLSESVAVALPDLARRPVAVERTPEGDVLFAIHQAVAAPAASKRINPKRVGLLWDASLSRKDADHARELGVVRAWIDALGPRNVQVDLTLFADRPVSAGTFALPKDGEALLAALGDVVYDGGTALSSLPVAAKAPDLYLLFSDGVGNLGASVPPELNAPLFAVNGAAIANHDVLRALALASGGARIDLASTSDADAIDRIGRSPFAFRGATGDGFDAGFPRIAEPVAGTFSYAGRLTGETSTISLRFGGPGAKDEVRTVTVSAADAVEGTLLQRFWAGKVVSDLAVGGKANEPAMAEVGKRYGIVTPGTSLLVLERLDQYIEHEVRPPASLVEFRAAYDEQQAARTKAVAVEDQRKLERIIGLWDERVAWWEREFDLSPKKKPVARPAKSAEAERSRQSSPAPMSAPAEVGAMMDRSMEESEADDVSTGGMERKKKDGSSAPDLRPSITLKAWDPQTPYLAKLKAAASQGKSADELVAVYLGQRDVFGTSPGFFLDCADFFAGQEHTDLARRVLSNLVELELEDPALMRVFAQRLIQLGDLDLAIQTLERVAELRPDEPQSHRDLGLALAARADSKAGAPGLIDSARADYQAALDALATVVMEEWQRFDQIELIALVELNDILVRAQGLGTVSLPVDPRLIRHLDMDVRIVMSWDADMTDMDLHVLEPSGEEAYYSHNRTRIGGRVSRDFTQGYGPEEYTIRRAMKGTYTVRTKFFGSSAATLQGAVTLTVDLYTDYGRPTQHHESLTLRLTENKETFTVGELRFEGPAAQKVTR